MKLWWLIVFSPFAFAHTQFVTEPEHCLKKTTPCIVKNISHGVQVLHLKNVEISLHTQTVLQIDDEMIELISGEWLLTVREPSIFRTLHGDISLSHGVLLVRVNSELTIDVLDGDAELLPRGQQQKINMPSGYHWALSGITSRGIASVNIPQSSSYKDVIVRWAKLNMLNKHDFLEKAEAYKMRLVPVIEQSADLNQKLVTQLIEDDRKQKAQALWRKQQLERENGELRKLFRKKTELE